MDVEKEEDDTKDEEMQDNDGDEEAAEAQTETANGEETKSADVADGEGMLKTWETRGCS